MSAQLHPVEEDLFLSALERRSVEMRAAFLAEACRGDERLRLRVEALLAAHERAEGFLETPLIGSGAATSAADVSLQHDAPFPAALGPPGALEGYEEWRPVARGGMGVVYRARDPRLERAVAIKVLVPELVAQATARQRFSREARAAAAVRHENVVTIHAIDETAAGPRLVMEWIEGVTLQELVDRDERPDVAEVLRIAEEAARGLAAAHDAGVVHRDVKPGNVLLESGTGRVKITDFGLARAVDDVGLTRSGTIAGTPRYMSPEQADGRTVDHRSDLFGLGGVAYALLAGRPPFEGESTAAVLRSICEREPPSLSILRPDLPSGVAAVVERLLEKDPARRFASARGAAEGFAALRDGARDPVRRSVRRRMRWSARVAGATAAAVVVVVAIGLLLSGFGDPRRLSTERFAGTTGSSGAESTAAAAVRHTPDEPVPKPRKERDVVAVASPLDDGRVLSPTESQILPERAETPVIDAPGSLGELRRMTAPDRLYGLAVAPDGSRVFACCADKTIYAWDLGTGEPLMQLRGHAGNVQVIAISPDGSRLASCGFDRTLRLWDAATGAEIGLTPTAVPVLDVAFSPGGEELVASLASRPAPGGREPRGRTVPFDRKLNVYDAKTLRPVRTLPLDDGRRFSHVDWSPDGRWIAAGTLSGAVLLLDAATGAVVHEFVASGMAGPAHEVAFHHDSRRLHATASGNVLWCWSVPDGAQRSFHVSPQGVVLFDVSPDGRWLAAGGALELRIIDLTAPDGPVEVEKIPGHTSPVRDVSFVPTKPQIVTSGWDGTVRLWGAP